MIGYTCPKCGKHTDGHWRGRCAKPPSSWRRFLIWWRKKWQDFEVWFDPAREVHLHSEGREDEIKRPEDLP